STVESPQETSRLEPARMSLDEESPRPTIKQDPEAPTGTNALNYIVPVLEIVGFEVLLNLYDRNYVDSDVYGVTADSVRHNLHHAWVLDTDPFAMNMVA